MLGLFAIIQFVDISPYLGLVVGLGIAGSMLIATAFGSLVPLLLQRLDVDPAIATGPFVTTSIDILGVSLYLGIASFFQPLKVILIYCLCGSVCLYVLFTIYFTIGLHRLKIYKKKSSYQYYNCCLQHGMKNRTCNSFLKVWLNKIIQMKKWRSLL